MDNVDYPTIDLKIKVDFNPDDWNESDWLRLKDYLNKVIVRWVKDEMKTKEEEEIVMH